MFPLDQIADVGAGQSQNLKQISRELIFEVFQPIYSQYLNVTDRQTYGRTDRRGIIALCIASRGKTIAEWLKEIQLSK